MPPALGPTFEALRPAVERLARARPLERRLTREALGRAERIDRRRLPSSPASSRRSSIAAADAGDDAAAATLERARLERELAEAEGWLAAARARLANEAFMAKAPPAVVEGARAREAELADQVDRLRERLALRRRATSARRRTDGGGGPRPVRDRCGAVSP